MFHYYDKSTLNKSLVTIYSMHVHWTYIDNINEIKHINKFLRCEMMSLYTFVYVSITTNVYRSATITHIIILKMYTIITVM